MLWEIISKNSCPANLINIENTVNFYCLWLTGIWMNWDIYQKEGKVWIYFGVKVITFRIVYQSMLALTHFVIALQCKRSHLQDIKRPKFTESSTPYSYATIGGYGRGHKGRMPFPLRSIFDFSSTFRKIWSNISLSRFTIDRQCLESKWEKISSWQISAIILQFHCGLKFISLSLFFQYP